MKLRKILKLFNLNLTEEIEGQFMAYYELLIEWNKVMNLTSITVFDDVVEKHFLDSIILGRYIDLNRELKLIDVGTGAGFPGIPLKIMFPSLQIVLMDSLKKRIQFLDEAAVRLNLKGIQAVHGRAEDLAQNKDYREQFDLSVSRAVANLSVLSEYCLPFVKTGGVFAAYKSGEIEREAEEAKKAAGMLGGRLREVCKFQLPDTDYQRSFVLVDKVESTLKKYPRKAGIPARQPLGKKT